MNYELVRKELSELLEGDATTSVSDLASHATDWSLFAIRPDLVVYPKDADDLQKLVTYVNDVNTRGGDKLTLTARAAGSGMSGGSLNHSIIVDVTKYMNEFKGIEVGDFGTQTHRSGFAYPIAGTATAQPGMGYTPFEERTLNKGFIMPVFPASRKLCALGGMVANNGAGEKSLKYGQNKDFVQSLRVILADGNEYEIKPLTYDELRRLTSKKTFLADVAQNTYRLVKDNWKTIQSARPNTSKNASGYLLWDLVSAPSIKAFESGTGYFDMTKLFVGAQGTTGIISEITYKLVPHENKEEMIVMFARDLADLPKIVEVLSRHDLDTIELYDDHTFKIGIKFFRDFVKDKGFFEAITYAARFLPEFWMAMTGGVPKFVILAESADANAATVHQEVLAELADLKTSMPHLKSFIARGRSAEKYWDFRHDSFKLLTEHSKASRAAGSGTRTAPFIDDIAVNPEHLPEYLPELADILDEYQDEFVYTIAGHLGNGNFHIIPLVDMNKPENKARIVEISDRVYELVLRYGGSISAEHNDGIVRTPYLVDMFGAEVVSLFKKVKDILDPKNIFNPGKKIGMTKDDITKYLA